MIHFKKYYTIIEARNVPILLLTLSLFLFKIPPFYLLFFFPHNLLMSQTLARLLIGLVFIHIIIWSYMQKGELRPFSFNNSQKKIVFLILLLFAFQSFSILTADNYNSFIRRYKDVLIAFMAFLVFYKYKHGLKLFIYSFIASLLVNTIYQSALLLFPTFSKNILSQLIYSEHWTVVYSKLFQKRIHTDTYDEIVLPFLLIPQYYNGLSKYITPIGAGIITFFSFVSNIRSRMLIIFFEFSGSIISFKLYAIKKLVIIFLLTLIALITSFYIAESFLQVSFVSRILLENEYTDVKTLNSRVDQLQNAYDISITHPLGVGLGNYYDYVGNASWYKFQTTNWSIPDRIGAAEYVHNYFGLIAAESGLISAGIFLTICILLFKKDYNIMKFGASEQKALVLAFWGLFIFSMFNPPIPGSFQVLFWGIRGLLL